MNIIVWTLMIFGGIIGSIGQLNYLNGNGNEKLMWYMFCIGYIVMMGSPFLLLIK